MLNNTQNQKGTNNSSLDLTLAHETDNMSSLEIAELTGKRHDAILRDIRTLLSQGVSAHNFVESSYQDKSGKNNPCYELTKKGCLILASGYNALLREKIINRWEELEKKARQPKELSRKDLALMVIKAEEEKERLQLENEQIKSENEQIKGENEIVKLQNEQQSEQLKQQAPKVEYVDKVLSSTGTYCTNVIAKELGMSAITLNRKLKAMGVQYKMGGTWLLTYRYQGKGYTKSKTVPFTRADGSPDSQMQTVWTEKGRAFIHTLMEKENKRVSGNVKDGGAE